MTAAGVKILGVVIAGGRSRRMGERDKLWLDFDGEPLIARAARRLNVQTGEVILNVNRHDERLEEIGLPVVRDLNSDFQGPLAGICASLGWAKQYRPDVTHIVCASVDSPFFPEELVARLAAGTDGQPDEIAVAFSEGYPHPVFSLWPISALEPLSRFLTETDNLKLMGYIRSRPWRRVDFPEHRPPAFFNINTPEDLAAAEGFLEEEAARG